MRGNTSQRFQILMESRPKIPFKMRGNTSDAIIFALLFRESAMEIAVLLREGKFFREVDKLSYGRFYKFLIII